MRSLAKTAAAALVVVLTMGASAESCEHQQRLAKCEKAFRAEYKRVLDQDEEDTDGKRPKECRGVKKSDLKKIAVRVIREETPKLDDDSDA